MLSATRLATSSEALVPVKCEESASFAAACLWFVLRTAALSMDLSRAGEVVVSRISVLLSSKNWKGEGQVHFILSRLRKVAPTGPFTLRHRSGRCDLPRSQILRKAGRSRTGRVLQSRHVDAWLRAIPLCSTSRWELQLRTSSGLRTTARVQRGICLPSSDCAPQRPGAAWISTPHQRCLRFHPRTSQLGAGHTCTFFRASKLPRLVSIRSLAFLLRTFCILFFLLVEVTARVFPALKPTPRPTVWVWTASFCSPNCRATLNASFRWDETIAVFLSANRTRKLFFGPPQ